MWCAVLATPPDYFMSKIWLLSFNVPNVAPSALMLVLLKWAAISAARLAHVIFFKTSVNYNHINTHATTLHFAHVNVSRL